MSQGWGMTLYRVQAADGRGPWRPGLSRFWIDEDCDKPLPEPVQDAFPDVFRRIPRGWHAGCACRSVEDLRAWFSPIEEHRLEAMGYSPVQIVVDKILAENHHQVVFARRKPLNQDVILLPWRKAA